VNLALVLRAYSTDGGTERYVVGLSRWLADRGHQVHVYAVHVDPGLDGHPGVHLHRLAVRTTRGIRGIRQLERAARAVPRGDHDLVQGFGRTTHHDVFRAGGGAHQAWLAERHPGWLGRLRVAMDPRHRLECRIDREALTTARIVVCNSQMAADDVLRWHPGLGGRVRVVRNGVDLGRFRPDPGRRERARRQLGVIGRVAVFLGHGFRRKGLEVAAEAFARIARSEDRLVVIGRDAHARPARRRLRALLGRKLVWMGPVDRPECWLPAADAMVLPTRYDPAANATLEALACGVPPVVSGRDGSAEVVPDGRLVVAEPSDVDGFARALRYAWEGADLGPRCRQAAEAWPVSRSGEAMEAIYVELVHG